MRKNRSELYLAIFVIAVIAVTAFLYQETQGAKSFNIFPEKLGDMNLALYREGGPAIVEVKNMHRGANVEIENAYIAEYRSSTGNKSRFWVSESKSSGEAVSLLTAMNSRVGTTGMFSESTPLNIDGTAVYFVTGLGEYHYFWAKDKKVLWLQINNPDKAYQLGIVKESIKSI